MERDVLGAAGRVKATDWRRLPHGSIGGVAEDRQPWILHLGDGSQPVSHTRLHTGDFTPPEWALKVTFIAVAPDGAEFVGVLDDEGVRWEAPLPPGAKIFASGDLLAVIPEGPEKDGGDDDQPSQDAHR